MKLITRCPSQRRLLRELSTSSHLSSISVENIKPELIPQESLRSLRRRRGVCIAEEENEVYFNADDLSEEEIEAAWYTVGEMEAFREETLQLATKMLGKHSPWKRAIQIAYQQLATGTCTDIERLVETCNFPVSGLTRGLEKHVLLPNERTMRRTRQRQQVQHWTATLDCREHDRALHIVTASRRESQPSRLFAHFVARVAAGES